MSKYENIQIYKVIEKIRQKGLVLPSIQREFVWNPKQIEKLFDSLMQGFPIGTFLFWNVAENREQYKFYEFMNRFSQNQDDVQERHNKETDLPREKDVWAVLDGQQRLTSIYLGLAGSYTLKKPYARKGGAELFEEKKLYLNLTRQDEDENNEHNLFYDFEFLTKEEVEKDVKNIWFLCNQILTLSNDEKIDTFIEETGLYDNLFGKKALKRFGRVINDYPVISYFLEDSSDLNKVLQIFVRTNDGGTKLEYSDLLLSIATAYWSEGDKNARDIIHKFVDDINAIGKKFKFNKDVVLKACLVLLDLDVKFDTKNFTVDNIKKIQAHWSKISMALKTSVKLLDVLGYNKDNLIANNAIIPIAYFVYKNLNIADDLLYSQKQAENRRAISQWLARSLLKGIFGGQADQIYPKMRNALNKSSGKFDLENILDEFSNTKKDMSFTEQNIDGYLEKIQYGDCKCHCILSLIYDQSITDANIDHIHADKQFSKDNLKELNLSSGEVAEYLLNKNRLSNLQLLYSADNKSKSGKALKEWLDQEFQNREDEKKRFFENNMIGQDWSFDFKDFLEFSEKRQAVIKSKLMRVLGVKKTEHVEDINQVA